MSDETEYFTVVFRGDIRKLGLNPLFAQTVFGEVVGISIGDALSARVATLEAALTDAGVAMADWLDAGYKLPKLIQRIDAVNAALED